MKPYVGYYRVSTAGQGRSGLGLEAQQFAVATFVDRVGGCLIAEFREVESGSNAERAALEEALRHCAAHKAVLVIAKLDRLARNLHFITQLLESRVEFVAADMPTANKLTIHILAAMAEHERDAISERTRAALQAAKARGVRLGTPDVHALSRAGVESRKREADARALRVLPILEGLQAKGVSTYEALADALTAAGVATARGGKWTPASVRNIALRAVAS